jgi:tetratricopeptide (TPR) repeat protein
MLRQALEAAPDDPSLLNNLASAYTMLGRNDEADAITRRIARDYPEYFFGQVGLAQLEARARRTEAAHRILDGLQGRVRYHRSEFVGLCLAQIEVLLVEKNPAGARSWLDLLASVDPEHPSIPRLRAIIKRAR